MMSSKPPHRLLTNLTKALWDTELLGVRISLAMAEFFWAVMLLWPGESFSRPTYKYMAVIADETVWATVFLLSCAIQMGIVVGGCFHGRFARYFAGWNAVVWLYVGIFSPLFSVSPPPAAMGGEMALAIAALWVWVRPYLLAKGIARVERTK